MLLVKIMTIALSAILVQATYCSNPDYYSVMRSRTPFQHSLLLPQAMDIQTFAANIPGGQWVQVMFLKPPILPFRLTSRFSNRPDTGQVILRYLLSGDFNTLNWELTVFRSPFARQSGEECTVIQNLRNQFQAVGGNLAIFRGIDTGRIRENRYFSRDPSIYLWSWFCMDATRIRNGRCPAGEGFLSLQIRSEAINRRPIDVIMDDLRCQLHLFPDDKRFSWSIVGDPCALRKPSQK